MKDLKRQSNWVRLNLCGLGVFFALLLLASQVLAETAKSSATLDRIVKKGVIHVGVKTDFPPFGMLNLQGEPEGFEIDLASDVARQLGVRVVTVGVTTENRFQKLEQGDVDVIISTVADTRERRQIATAIEPDYYAGGVSIFLRPGQKIAGWMDVRGHKICATQGAYFNRPMSQRFFLDLHMYRGTRDALMALRDGRCIGFLYSSAAIQGYLKKPEWEGYQAPLPIAMLAPWAVYVSRNEKDSGLERRLGDIVAGWHRSGFLIEREKAWGILPSKFLEETQALWLQRDGKGRYVCERQANGQWPTDCRNPAFVRSDEVGGLLKLGFWIEENTGMKLTFIYDGYDRGIFFKGLLYSMILMAASIYCSLALGLAGALAAESRFTWMGRLVRGAAVYGRMTPPLLQMYLIFFGIGALIWAKTGVNLSPLWVAVWCLSFYTGSSVMSSLLESAGHLRSKRPDFRLRLDSIEKVVELSSVQVKATLVNVTKQSVMASALAIPELISATTSIMSDQGNVNVMMNVFLVVFVLLISLWMGVLDWLERKFHARKKSQS